VKEYGEREEEVVVGAEENASVDEDTCTLEDGGRCNWYERNIM